MGFSYYTQEGIDKLKEEIQHLKTVERPSISAQIGEAREKGDLSENAEYDAAKEAQGLLEMKISKLDKLLANARLVDEASLDLSKILILSKVKVKNLANDKEFNYTLVSEQEADIKAFKISVSSPIGKGLLGKKKEDIVEIKVPSGDIIKLKVLEITR